MAATQPAKLIDFYRESAPFVAVAAVRDVRDAVAGLTDLHTKGI